MVLTGHKDPSQHCIEAAFIEWHVGSLTTQTDEKNINRPMHHFEITAL